MNIWLIGIGEPLSIDGKNVRLRRLGNLASYISLTNNELHYFSVSFNHYEKKQRVKKDTIIKIESNYSLHIVRVPGYKNNVSLRRIISHKVGAKKIKNLMIKEIVPDIILTGNTPLELVKEVAKYGEEKGVPVVVDMRDLWPEIFKEVVSKKLRFFVNPYVYLCRKSLSKSMKKVFSIIGLSEPFMKYGLNIAGRDKCNIDRVIPIGYPNYNYNISSVKFDELWKNYNISSNDFIVAFTGNFGRQFDFTSIIQASKILSGDISIKFVLCGIGENLEKVKKQCKDNVIFPGWIEKDMINSLLSNANVGIAPYIDSFNYRNNTPNKFGEYLSAGLPILVSVSGVMENLLSINNCGSRYKDGKDLAQLIREYKYNDYKQKRINARNLYDREFNADFINDKLLKHLLQVVKEFKKNK
ncbi:glycosyltransferase family 4 protein [Clostridium cadaveris]|uniref:glycosyltransferase family 4 protein n=1 Tax=Clostridium cadaveris TaxID=1529 RepID=UPI000487BCFC|nr:glycosyltransferase family 4 protein [Clostridium cadaveris]